MDYKNLEMLAWLVAQFRRAGKKGITYDELTDHLFAEPNMDKNLSKRTFHHYLKELRTRFGINIECDRSLQFEIGRMRLSEENRRYRYRLTEEALGKSIPWAMPFLWAMDTSAVLKQMNEDDINNKIIHIEQSKTGSELVIVLLDAIKQQRCIDLQFTDPKTNLPYPYRQFEPCGLVLKDFVWFLLGHTCSHTPKVWPLHTLSNIIVSNTQYQSTGNFSAEGFWRSYMKANGSTASH